MNIVDASTLRVQLMRVMRSIVLFSLVVFICLSAILGFRSGAFKRNGGAAVSSSTLFARLKKNMDGHAVPPAPTFAVGENVPDEILQQNCIYDMVLVERFSQPEKTDFGLFLPKVEGKDGKHLGKVISVPTSHGLESEHGRVAPVSEIIPYKVGDVVYVRDAWGIGPLQQEVGLRCFSFHKAAQITGLVKSD